MTEASVRKMMELAERVELKDWNFDYSPPTEPDDYVWLSVSIFLGFNNIPSIWDLSFPKGTVFVWKEHQT